MCSRWTHRAIQINGYQSREMPFYWPSIRISFETTKWLYRPPVNASEDVVPLLVISEEQSHSEHSGEVGITREISISHEMMI